MSFFASFEDCKRLNSYLHADTYYQQTKPIRGKTHLNYRPLRSNRRDHSYKALHLREDSSGNKYYAAKLYNTDLIEYHPDHIVLNTATTWFSRSTQEFFNAVLPHWAHVIVHKDNFWVSVSGSPYFIPNKSTKLRINVDGSDWYKPVKQEVSAMQVHMRRVNRKQANALYKPLAGFFEWVNAMEKLECLDQMVAIALDYPVELDAHQVNEAGERRSFWHTERNFCERGGDKFAELVSKAGGATPEDFPKMVTLILSMNRGLRSSWRSTSPKTFWVESTTQAIKAFTQKLLVSKADAYTWEHREYDRRFPSQVIRVQDSELITVGG